jgi:hypothetical protein
MRDEGELLKAQRSLSHGAQLKPTEISKCVGTQNVDKRQEILIELQESYLAADGRHRGTGLAFDSQGH